MPRTYEECLLAILEAPEDDGLRRELASIVKASDPQLAELIELQLDLSDGCGSHADHAAIRTDLRSGCSVRLMA